VAYTPNAKASMPDSVVSEDCGEGDNGFGNCRSDFLQAPSRITAATSIIIFDFILKY
jgi:hypothetical protein